MDKFRTVSIGFLILCLNSYCQGERIHFDGYKVLRVQAHSQQQLDQINQLTGRFETDFWSSASIAPSHVDIQVKGTDYHALADELLRHNISSKVLIQDIEQVIKMSLRGHSDNIATLAAADQSSDVVGRYARFSEMESWLKRKAENHTDIVKLTKIGHTHQNRPLWVLQIGKPQPGMTKPIMWIDGGIHAREWVSPASVIYVIDKGWQTREVQVINLLNTIDIYILPVVNPDGYEYSHTTHRLWRKNRSPNSNSNCVGTDLNRNWSFQWGGEGSSSNPCSYQYRGSKVASEAETVAVSNFITNTNSGRVKGFLTVHSYTQAWTTRWGYTREKAPLSFETCQVVRKMATAASNLHGKEYQWGIPSMILYIFSGGSGDWARGVAGIKHAYEVELRDTGHYGFLLPPDQIIPTAEELMAGVLVVAEQVAKEYGQNIGSASGPEQEGMDESENFYPSSSLTDFLKCALHLGG